MDITRPGTDAELSSILKRAYGHAQKGQYKEALAICDWLIDDESTRVAGLRQRAAVKELMDDIDGAIADLKELLSISACEPSDFHQLGTLTLVQGSAKEAISYFAKAIELEKDESIYYYTNSSLLHMAEAELRCNHWKEAKVICQRLPEGYKACFYGKGMRTREQIEKEADAGLSRRR